MNRSKPRFQEDIVINPGPCEYENQKVQPVLQKSQSFNIKGSNDLISQTKSVHLNKLNSNLAFPGPTS